MGLAISNSFVQNTVNSLTTIVSTTVNNATQDLQQACSGVNVFTGIFGKAPVEIRSDGTIVLGECSTGTNVSGDGLRINQNSQNSCSIRGGLNSEVTQNITNELSSNINQWLTAEASANNGIIGIGVSIAASEGITQVDLANQIANSVTSNIAQTCNASLVASNTGTVYICGNYPNGVVITQSAVNTNLTSCIINNVVTNIGNNKVLNDIVQKAVVKADAKNEGLEGIFSWLKWVLIAVAVLVFLGIILFFVFGNKSSPPKEDPKKAEIEMLQKRVEEKRRLEAEGIPAIEPASHASPYSTHDPSSPYANTSSYASRFNMENINRGIERFRGNFNKYYNQFQRAPIPE